MTRRPARANMMTNEPPKATMMINQAARASQDRMSVQPAQHSHFAG